MRKEVELEKEQQRSKEGEEERAMLVQKSTQLEFEIEQVKQGSKYGQQKYDGTLGELNRVKSQLEETVKHHQEVVEQLKSNYTPHDCDSHQLPPSDSELKVTSDDQTMSSLCELFAKMNKNLVGLALAKGMQANKISSLEQETSGQKQVIAQQNSEIASRDW